MGGRGQVTSFNREVILAGTRNHQISGPMNPVDRAATLISFPLVQCKAHSAGELGIRFREQREW